MASRQLGTPRPSTYDTASNVVTVTLPNGIVSISHYDQLNRLTSLTSPVSSYTYQLSPTGNRTSSSELNGRTLTWNYNGVYQLTEQTVAADPAGIDGSATYGLDPVGNRLSTSSTLSGILNGTYSYNPDDELASETYDPNGNVLTTGGNALNYDSENQLTGMNVGYISIVYDGDGNRVAETIGGVMKRFLVDDLNPTGYAQVVDEVSGGVVARAYAYGLNLIDQNQPINGTWTTSFYGYDGGGTVRQLTNLTGSVTDTYEYDAFGYLLTSTGTTPNNYLYRGEQYDPNLSLYYLRARYYNPNVGRFLSRDPVEGDSDDPKTLHKYLYASGNPTNVMDPTGRSATDVAIVEETITFPQIVRLVAITGALDCVLEFSVSKFTGAIELARAGGSLNQVGPCVWLFTNASRALPRPSAPTQAAPGTRASPWPPQCNELEAAVQAAKLAVQGLECIEDLHYKQLEKRYDLWLGLATARQALNDECFNGGDGGHQQAVQTAYDEAENCAEILENK